jgi:hypothetical protein
MPCSIRRFVPPASLSRVLGLVGGARPDDAVAGRLLEVKLSVDDLIKEIERVVLNGLLPRNRG